MNQYIGHINQVYGVEEMRLTGGKADGMRMLYVRNGKGLEFWVSVDRCADISRASLKGDNYAYFSPCGYVSPKHYDNKGGGFLKSFTAGFFTTCGFNNVGGACVDNGEELPVHGTISNIPCENIGHWIADDGIHIKAIVRDAAIFADRRILEREYIVSLEKNEIQLIDKIKNIGYDDAPLEVLYHCNMGYPLLSENAEITIPSTEVEPATDFAKEHLDSWKQVEKPQRGIGEMCYYHTMTGKPEVSIFNPDINKGLTISYDASELPYFLQWKLMGEQDYVMGLEPGNCKTDGRNVMREKGILEILKPGETKTHHITFTFTEK